MTRRGIITVLDRFDNLLSSSAAVPCFTEHRTALHHLQPGNVLPVLDYLEAAFWTQTSDVSTPFLATIVSRLLHGYLLFVLYPSTV